MYEQKFYSKNILKHYVVEKTNNLFHHLADNLLPYLLFGM